MTTAGKDQWHIQDSNESPILSSVKMNHIEEGIILSLVMKEVNAGRLHGEAYVGLRNRLKLEPELREQIAKEIEAYVFEGYSTNYSAVTHTIEQAARIARKDLPPATLPDGHQLVNTETARRK